MTRVMLQSAKEALTMVKQQLSDSDATVRGKSEFDLLISKTYPWWICPFLTSSVLLNLYIFEHSSMLFTRLLQ